MGESNVEEKLKTWLQTQGYPLEMFAAQLLRKHRFAVTQSEFYADPESGDQREVDMVGYIQESIPDRKIIRCRLVVECKVSKDKPWVMFTCDTRLAAPAKVVQRATSRPGHELLYALAKQPDIQQLPIFDVPPRAGYGVTQGFTSGNDSAYSACIAVAKAARGVAIQYDSKSYSLIGTSVAEIVFPVILIEGRLFEAFLTENNELMVEEISSGVLVWRNPVVGMPHTIIHVVTREAFSELLVRARESFVRLIEATKEQPNLIPDARPLQAPQSSPLPTSSKKQQSQGRYGS
jgi:hypothetical protein